MSTYPTPLTQSSTCEWRKHHEWSSGPRPALHQYHPDTFDGCHTESQFWTSWHTDGTGTCRLLFVATLSAVRSRRPDLAKSRPLRPLEWSRLDAAVQSAPPRRCQGGQREIRAGWQTLRDPR